MGSDVKKHKNFIRQQFNESCDRYSVLYDEILRNVTNDVIKIKMQSKEERQFITYKAKPPNSVA